MNDDPHATPEPADDDEAALVQRVAAAQAARLGRPVPTDRDPHAVRRDLIDDRDAAMIALAVLRRDRGAAVPDAIECALAGFNPRAAAKMPPAVAMAILQRLPDQHRAAVWDTVDPVLEQFGGTDGNPALAELCVHRIAHTVRAAMAATIAAELAGSVDHDGHPVDGDTIAAAATGAADVAVQCLADRLRDDLLTMAGLP